jgi:hypothetical protein
MNLNGNNLTINIGDSVGFFENCSPNTLDDNGYFILSGEDNRPYITGEVVAILESNHLRLLVRAQFSDHEIPARRIHQINNLCVGMNNFIKHLNIKVAL